MNVLQTGLKQRCDTTNKSFVLKVVAKLSSNMRRSSNLPTRKLFEQFDELLAQKALEADPNF